MIRVFEAVKSRWDAQSLGSTFTGGMWGQSARIPKDTAFPYVRLVSLGKAPNAWSTDSQYSSSGVQFSIFYKEDGSTDPLLGLRALAETLKAAFPDDVALTVASAGGDFLHMRVTGEDFVEEEDGTWHYFLSYTVERRHDRT
jgi:hypothetical protein